MRFVSSCNIAAALYVVDQFAAYEFVVGKNKGFRVDFVAKRLKKNCHCWMMICSQSCCMLRVA